MPVIGVDPSLSKIMPEMVGKGVVVIVTLRARYESLEASTNAAFLPWW